MSAIDRLLANNATFADRSTDDPAPGRPSQQLAIVACMDARLELGALLGLREGDAHVVRNAGGVVTNDVLRSLTVSQRLLGTREIMVIMHTDCGMTTFTDEQLASAIAEDTGAQPPFPILTFSDLEGELRRSLARIRGSPFLPHPDGARGFVYDVVSRRLREVS